MMAVSLATSTNLKLTAAKIKYPCRVVVAVLRFMSQFSCNDNKAHRVDTNSAWNVEMLSLKFFLPDNYKIVTVD